MNGKVFAVADEVKVWIADGGSIHLKTCEPSGDPVELTEEDARELAAILTRLVEELGG
ncbi:MAG: hypothetical protein JWQ29_3313 [Phenylobacterium sp.]|nr:hypothetical protein [Phenylobacterium sp.]